MILEGFRQKSLRIEKFINVFGAGNVDVRVFDRTLFKGGDVLADFTDAIGMPGLFNDLTKIRANASKLFVSLTPWL